MENKSFDFLFPSRIKWEKSTYGENYGQLVVEPLERGFGVTVGNALRRVLLSSIPGVAVTGIRISGILHEFSVISGVKEDFTQIILNIKQIACKPVISEFPHRASVKISGKSEICADDLITDGSVEILNKDLHIATVDSGTKLEIEVEVTRGTGYVPVDKMKLVRKDSSPGFILVDGIYTPVKKVSFRVEPARVGPLVDYEKLIIDIWTNGSVSPLEAVNTATGILNNHFTLIGANQTIGEKQVADFREKSPEGLDIPIAELKLTTRVVNALTSKKIQTLQDVLNMSRETFQEMKNLGKKSIQEIEDMLAKRGLSLKEETSKKTE